MTSKTIPKLRDRVNRADLPFSFVSGSPKSRTSESVPSVSAEREATPDSAREPSRQLKLTEQGGRKPVCLPRSSAGDAGGTEAPPADRGGTGLVYRCISGQGAVWNAAEKTVLEVYHRDVKVIRKILSPVAPKGGKRTKIYRFSRASGRRLVWFARNCEEIDHVGVTGMITLTYPAEFPWSGKIVKKHLSLFRHWLWRQENIGGLWCLEFQKRGAPHFHLIVTRLPDKAAVSQRWFEIVGSGDQKHLRAGTRCEHLRQTEGAACYVAKYAAKQEQKEVPQEFADVGGFWNHWGVAIDPIRLHPVGGCLGVVRQIRRGVQSKRRALNVARTCHNQDTENARFQELFEQREMVPVLKHGEWVDHSGVVSKQNRFLRPARDIRDDGKRSIRFYDGARFAGVK